jgi:hypothetical protein
MGKCLEVRATGKLITFGDLPSFPLTAAKGMSAPQPFQRILEFHAKRASAKAREMGWSHEPVGFSAASRYKMRSAVLAWLEDAAAAGAGVAQPPAIVAGALQELV